MIAASIAAMGMIGLHDVLSAGVLDSQAATNVVVGDWPW
jgi:hypothetical protein